MFDCEVYMVSCILLMVFAVSLAVVHTWLHPRVEIIGSSHRMATPPPRAAAVLIGPNENKEMFAYPLPVYPDCAIEVIIIPRAVGPCRGMHERLRRHCAETLS